MTDKATSRDLNKTIREIKKEFMTYRNGVIADTLRQAGWPHKVIFGLNLPQITAIAHTLTTPDRELGEMLWNDHEVRESRLLAPFLLPGDMPMEEAIAIIGEPRTREEADLLAFRWLRYHESAKAIADRNAESNNDTARYLAEAINRFL